MLKSSGDVSFKTTMPGDLGGTEWGWAASATTSHASEALPPPTPIFIYLSYPLSCDRQARPGSPTRPFDQYGRCP